MVDLSSLDLNEACRYLSACDKELLPKLSPTSVHGLSPEQPVGFQYLCRSIVYQQLSGKAAGTIHGRLLDLFERRRVNAETLLCCLRRSYGQQGFRIQNRSRSTILHIASKRDWCLRDGS